MADIPEQSEDVFGLAPPAAAPLSTDSIDLDVHDAALGETQIIPAPHRKHYGDSQAEPFDDQADPHSPLGLLTPGDAGLCRRHKVLLAVAILAVLLVALAACMLFRRG